MALTCCAVRSPFLVGWSCLAISLLAFARSFFPTTRYLPRLSLSQEGHFLLNSAVFLRFSFQSNPQSGQSHQMHLLVLSETVRGSRPPFLVGCQNLRSDALRHSTLLKSVRTLRLAQYGHPQSSNALRRTETCQL